jgi:hypothetical protein
MPRRDLKRALGRRERDSKTVRPMLRVLTVVSARVSLFKPDCAAARKNGRAMGRASSLGLVARARLLRGTIDGHNGTCTHPHVGVQLYCMSNRTRAKSQERDVYTEIEPVCERTRSHAVKADDECRGS